MAMTDPVGDLLTRIRNGQAARLDSVTAPASRMRSNVLDVLQREGYIRAWKLAQLGSGGDKVTPRFRDYLLDGCTLAALGPVSLTRSFIMSMTRKMDFFICVARSLVG